SVRIDVADIGRLEIGIAHRVLHDTKAALVLGRRLGDVVSVAAHAVADDLCHDPGAARFSVFEFFQNEDAGTLANDEAVTRRIPGATGFFRLAIADGKGAHGGKSSYAHGCDGCFAAARDHDIGIAMLDDTERIAH